MGATGGYEPTPASEDLASLLQDLPAGAHIAVTLRGLEIGTALQVSRKAADDRGDRFVVIGDRRRFEGTVIADSLGNALRHQELAVPGRDTLVVVDAQTSVECGGAAQHAAAEKAVGLRPGLRLTVICFYTEDALQALTEGRVRSVHTMVAVPGQV